MVMRIFPASSAEWTDVALAPFKTYPILIFLMALVWSSEMRGQPMILGILFGYFVCMFMIGWAAAVDTFVTKSRTTAWNWFAAITVLGILFALKWLPTLAE